MSFSHTWRLTCVSLRTDDALKRCLMAFWDTTVDTHRAAAKRLVDILDAGELQILECLVCGMSVKATAATTGLTVDCVERLRISIMKKLNVRRAADVVRIGLYAKVDPPG